jgi:hypothetical protein
MINNHNNEIKSEEGKYGGGNIWTEWKPVGNVLLAETKSSTKSLGLTDPFKW